MIQELLKYFYITYITTITQWRPQTTTKWVQITPMSLWLKLYLEHPRTFGVCQHTNKHNNRGPTYHKSTTFIPVNPIVFVNENHGFLQGGAPCLLVFLTPSQYNHLRLIHELVIT